MERPAVFSCTFLYRVLPVVNTVHLKQSSPVPVILTTVICVCIQLGSGTNALALYGSRCHSNSCKETKFENTQPEPFCFYTSMKFNSGWWLCYYSRINRFVENNADSNLKHALCFCWKSIITGLKTAIALFDV